VRYFIAYHHYVAEKRTAVNEIVKESKSRGVTFFTALAGTALLGVQFATVAASLWVFAVLLWIILIYTFFAAVTVAEPKPSLVLLFTSRC
jgi:hypothetical protein